MSDNNIDILNDNTPVDLNQVRTALPIIKPSTQSGIIKKVEVTQNNKKTGYNLSLELTLTNPAEAEDGKEVQPGFPIFDLVSLVRTYAEDGITVKYDPIQKLVAIVEAVTGEKTGSLTPKEIVLAIQGFVGRQVAFRLQVVDDEQYGRKNRVARYIKAV